jgi:glycine/D-amino acid oxidase-like deaminating enzyme
VRFEGQAQFHPRKYLLALAGELKKAGCEIYENTRVVDLEENREGFTLMTGNGKKVTAKRVVIASHYPFFNKAALYFARLYVERSYIIAVQAKEKYPGGMYISADDPVRSLRSQPSERGELTLVGGENHKTGQSGDTYLHYRALADFAHQYFDAEDIPFHWSAQDVLRPVF